MQPIQPETFDPTATNSGSFRVSLANFGWLVIINDSPSGLKLTFGNNEYTKTVPPGCLRSMKFSTRINDVQWKVAYTLPVGQAPISIVVGECYDLTEWEEGEIIVSLVRQVNQGNPVVGGTASQVLNDGNVANTQVVEATQSGSSGSNLKADNSGNFLLAEFISSVYTAIFQVIAGASSGADVVKLGKAGNFITHVLSKFLVDGASTFTGQINGSAQVLITQGGSASGGTNYFTMNQSGGPGGTGQYTWGVDQSGNVLLFDINNNGSIFTGTKTLLKANSSTFQILGTIAANNATDKGVTLKDNSPNVEFDAVAPANTARGLIFAAIDTSGVLHAGIEVTSNGVARVGSNDPTLGNPRLATYIGTTDPSGRTGVTVSDGDLWINA